jgi:hypothetical protein
VDGVVSPALIASDSIWAVAEKALEVDGSVRDIEREIQIGYVKADYTLEHFITHVQVSLGFR